MAVCLVINVPGATLEQSLRYTPPSTATKSSPSTATPPPDPEPASARRPLANSTRELRVLRRTPRSNNSFGYLLGRAS